MASSSGKDEFDTDFMETSEESNEEDGENEEN